MDVPFLFVAIPVIFIVAIIILCCHFLSCEGPQSGLHKFSGKPRKVSTSTHSSSSESSTHRGREWGTPNGSTEDIHGNKGQSGGAGGNDGGCGDPRAAGAKSKARASSSSSSSSESRGDSGGGGNNYDSSSSD